MTIFRNAITEVDGVSINIGYLSLYNLMVLDIALSVLLVGSGFWTQAVHAHNEYPYIGVAAAIAAVWGTFTTALGALGLFLVGDRRAPGQSTSTVTTTEHTTLVPAAPAAPAAPSPSAPGTKALSPVIAPEDVGGHVEIEPPKPVKRKGAK